MLLPLLQTLLPTPPVPPLQQQNANNNNSNTPFDGKTIPSGHSGAISGQLNSQLAGQAGANHMKSGCSLPWQPKDIQDKTGYGRLDGRCRATNRKGM